MILFRLKSGKIKNLPSYNDGAAFVAQQNEILQHLATLNAQNTEILHQIATMNANINTNSMNINTLIARSEVHGRNLQEPNDNVMHLRGKADAHDANITHEIAAPSMALRNHATNEPSPSFPDSADQTELVPGEIPNPVYFAILKLISGAEEELDRILAAIQGSTNDTIEDKKSRIRRLTGLRF